MGGRKLPNRALILEHPMQTGKCEFWYNFSKNSFLHLLFHEFSEDHSIPALRTSNE